MVVARDLDSMLEFGLLVGSLQLRILARNQVRVDRERDENADPMLPKFYCTVIIAMGISRLARIYECVQPRRFSKMLINN